MQSGVYTITNIKSGTALDLSAADNKSIIGFPVHEGTNQQWEIEPLGRGWTIRSVATGLYLTVEKGTGDWGEIPLVASWYPVSWVIAPQNLEKSVFQIFWPNTDVAFDLSNWGNETPGTAVNLNTFKTGVTCQMWRFKPCQTTSMLSMRTNNSRTDSRTGTPSETRTTRTEVSVVLATTVTTTTGPIESPC